jgi:branched-chain amino acid transport system substrate-binding protein
MGNFMSKVGVHETFSRRMLGALCGVFVFLVMPLSISAENQQPIRIGALFSLSGWGAQGGQAELNGAILAVEDSNARNGVGGRPLELVIEDNHSDLRASVTGFKKLAGIQAVPAIIGPNWAEFADVVAPLAAADGVSLITPSGNRNSFLKTDPWVFVLWPAASRATKLLADSIADQGFRSVSVVISENAYYRELLLALRPQLEERGISIVEELSFAPGSMDYRSAIVRLHKNRSQAVVAFLLESGEFAAFLKQRRELKFEAPLFGANTIPFDPIVQKDLSLANGLTYFDFIALGTPDFLKRYQERFKEPAGFASAKAYDAVQLLAKAISECGVERAGVRACLRRARHQGISGIIEFDEQGVIKDLTPNAKLFSVRNGAVH